MVPALRSVRLPPTARSRSEVKSLAPPSVALPPLVSDSSVPWSAAVPDWLMAVFAFSRIARALIVPALWLIAPPVEVSDTVPAGSAVMPTPRLIVDALVTETLPAAADRFV